MMREGAIRTLRYAHLGIIVFVLLGWLSPFDTLLWVHIILIPLTVVQWMANEGTCYLTNLEFWLMQKPLPKAEQQGQFIKSLLSKWYDPLPSDRKIKIGLYVVIWTSWSISLVRLLY